MPHRSPPRVFLEQLGRGLLNLIYPPACHLCDQGLTEQETAFCSTCCVALQTDTPYLCQCCAATVGPYVATDSCPRCQEERFRFASVLRLGRYDGPLREAVLRIKHHTHEGLAEALGRFYAEHHQTELLGLHVDAVVPMPLHWWRRWQRGYNQAESLALGLARTLGLPCRTGWLWRRRNTPRQAVLSPTARKENLKGAFAARSSTLRGKHLLLVDDVLTTGTTANEAARTLLAAGAGKVTVAVLARGEGH